jgi:uncharacterized protein with HEPN domain
MYDRELVLSILMQTADALEKIRTRTLHVQTPEDFSSNPEGMEKLDAACMLFVAIGESCKNLDKITAGSLFAAYPEIDWTGVKGFRDIIAHHYFDIDVEQVFWICKHNVEPLITTIENMIRNLQE